MKILITENKLKPILLRLLNMEFEGWFDNIYYDWANYNCGMGECCDPYAIGFTLPKAHYDDYLFKLVDDENYSPGGFYPSELSDELPEVCQEYPDIKNPNFDTIYFYEDNIENVVNFLGEKEIWSKTLLDIINDKFDCDATKIKFV
jgi:hypothetical protein